MKRKGFSLIELLAVLVILAVVALIAVPNVLNIIDDSKRSTAELSARNIARAAETYYANHVILHGEDLTELNLVSDEQFYDGERPEKGYAYFNKDGKAYVKLYQDGYCVISNYDRVMSSVKTDKDSCGIALFVFLELNGGTLDNNILEYEQNSTYGLLPVPKRNGYTFIGWFDKDDKQVLEEDTVVGTTTLYAKWEVNKYIVTLSSDVTIPNIEGWIYENGVYTKEITYDTPYGLLPNLTKNGYTFTGWYTTGGVKIEEGTILKQPNNHTLTSQFVPNEYKVTLKYNDDVTEDTIKDVTYNNEYGTLPIPTREGYTFDGWYLNNSKIEETTLVFETNDHTLVAKWNPNKYTITFNRQNFVNGEEVYFNPVTKEVCKSTEVTSTTGYKDGCMKWYAFLDDGSDTIKLILDHNTTGMIAWNTDTTKTTPDTALAQLQLDITNWDNEIKSTARLISAVEINQIAPAQSNYVWNINDHSTKYYLHTGNQTEYKGDAGTNKYAWLFDNTGNCKQFGCNIEDGSTLAYWTNNFASNTNAWRVTRAGYLYFGNTSMIGDTGIRPVIEVNKELLIETKEVLYGNTYGELPIIKRPGYNFIGWYTTSGVEVEETTNVNITSNQELYPQFGLNSYVVTFDGNGGTPSIPNAIIEYNSTYGELPTATREGYTFTGWYSTKTGGTKIENTTIMNMASNHSIYAGWEANTYTVTLNRTNFGNGEVVYFNPVTAKVCDASEVVSTTGYKNGCMKWYAFLDDGSNTVKLLLDHNTTALVEWNVNNGTTPDTVLAQLASDVDNWNIAIKNSARIISATEINQIAPPTIEHIWNINDYSSGYYLHTGNMSQYKGDIGTNKYAWLFDNTIDCEIYGGNISQNGTYGYWTSSFAETGWAWRIWGIGVFGPHTINMANSYGVRPVIEINKDLLDDTKEVTYDATYGELQQLSRPGYTFNGWYTTGGIKIENTTTVNILENQNLYAQWSANTYTITLNRTDFKNGEVVYFNPVTAKVCDASESVSTTGYKDGCMKWYAFLDDGFDTINLLLDHNTTALVAWNSDSTGVTPVTALSKLTSDVSGWNDAVKSTARLISADEVNRIVSTNSNWNVTSTSTWYYFHTGTQTPYKGAVGTNKYGWLFDNTNNCISYGCNTADNATNGYWTSSYAASNRAWIIIRDGYLGFPGVHDNSYGGIRPVIEIDKSLLTVTKEVTYDATYGTLPNIESQNYDFLGWYTKEGTSITYAAKANIISNTNYYSKSGLKDGEELYFNPTTGAKCTPSEAVSTTGTKDGCMKWYSFLDNGSSKVKLLLDHNTTGYGIAWNSDNTGTTPDTVNAQLQTDISNWNGSIKNAARLISATEVYNIAPTNPNWNINNLNTLYYLHTGTATKYEGTAGTNKYAWLFDNLSNCTTYGCNVEQKNAYGYWTSDKDNGGGAWYVHQYGLFTNNYVTETSYGVRPVIEVDRTIIE